MQQQFSLQYRLGYVPQKFDWTAERVEQLTAMWSEGLSAGSIARVFRKTNSSRVPTRNAVIGKVMRLNLPARATRGYERITARKSNAARTHVNSRLRMIANAAKPKLPPPINPRYELSPIPVPRAEDRPNIAFLDLEPHHCRWPAGDPVKGYCGCTKVAGLPYCASHAQRAYVPPNSRPKAPGESRQPPAVLTLRILETA